METDSTLSGHEAKLTLVEFKVIKLHFTENIYVRRKIGLQDRIVLFCD